MISFFVKEVWKLIVQNTCVHRLMQKLMDIWHYILTYLCVLRRNSKPRRGSDILDYRPLECCYLFTQKPHRSLHSLSSVESLEAKNILKPPAPIETTLWKGELSWNQSWKTQGNQQTSGKNRKKHLKKTVPKLSSGFLAFSLHEASVEYRKFRWRRDGTLRCHLLCQAKWENLSLNIEYCWHCRNAEASTISIHWGISGTLRHFQDRTVVNSRPAAFSRRYRVVSGLLGVLTTSSSWKDMSGRPSSEWRRHRQILSPNSDQVKIHIMPSLGKEAIQIWKG